MPDDFDLSMQDDRSRPIAGDISAPSHAAGTVDDAHEARSELESYRSALNHQAIVAVTDRAGTIVAVNDLFCAISKYERHELLGEKHSIIKSGHHPRSFFVELWRTIGSGGVWRGDICNRAKDGSLYWVDTTIVPKRGADGRIAEYVSVRYDISKHKQVEAALLQENRRRCQIEQLLRDVIEAMPNGIAAYDAEDRLVLFNSSYKEFYALMAPAIVEGASFESILRYGLDSGQFVHGRDSPSDSEA